jgi:hypothetical protein
VQIVVWYVWAVAQAFGLAGDGTERVRAFRSACDCFARMVSEQADGFDRLRGRLAACAEPKTPADTEY